MPLQPNTCLVSVEGSVTLPSGVVRRVVNSFPYRALPTAGVINPAALGTVFLSVVWASIRSRLHTDWVGFQTWGRSPCFDSSPSPLSLGVPASGTRTGNRLPLNAAVDLVTHTALRGRPFIGIRKFGPIPTLAVTRDELVGAELTAWSVVATRVAGVLTDANGTQWQPCVWSKSLSPAFGVGYQAFMTDITTVVRNKTIGLCRHRRERTP